MTRRFVRVRRGRPTLADAEAFLLGRPHGVWKSDYVSPKERLLRLAELRSQLKRLLRANLPSGPRLDLLILKAHLLVEFMLTQYIALRSYYEYDVSVERLTFPQKMAVAHILGYPLDPVLMPSLELLNRLRNQVAHGFELDRAVIDRFLRLYAEDPEAVADHTDRRRAGDLRSTLRTIVWGMLGVIEAQHVEAYEERGHGA